MAERTPEEKRCPDDGRCWHGCHGASCWRVLHCAPLSEFGDEWPASAIAENLRASCRASLLIDAVARARSRDSLALVKFGLCIIETPGNGLPARAPLTVRGHEVAAVLRGEAE